MIIDAFIFSTELDLLEIRLHTLASVVDRFVLVEADRTFQGAPKPFIFEENKKRFEAFLPKIKHVKTNLSEKDDGWVNESKQRNAIRQGLENVPDDALVMICDVDELPDFSNPFKIKCPLCWRMHWSYYYVDLKIGNFNTMVAVTRGQLRERFQDQPQKARAMRGEFELVENGWHFSYLGGPEAIAQKLRAFAHNEFAHKANDLREIEHAITQGWKNNVDVLGRNCFRFSLEKNCKLPTYLQENRSRFTHLFCP